MGASYPVAIQGVGPNMVVIVLDYVNRTEESICAFVIINELLLNKNK